MRLIDADALVENLELMYDHQDDKDEPYNIGVRGAINMAKKAPTIKPKRGEWKIEAAETIYGKAYLLTCSECGETVSVTETALPYEHFCRNCGAEMKGADDE